MRVFEVACGNVEKGAPVVSSVAGNGFGWCEIGPWCAGSGCDGAWAWGVWVDTRDVEWCVNLKCWRLTEKCSVGPVSNIGVGVGVVGVGPWIGAECGRVLCGVGITWDVVHVVGAVGLVCGGVGHDGIELYQGNIIIRLDSNCINSLSGFSSLLSNRALLPKRDRSRSSHMGINGCSSSNELSAQHVWPHQRTIKRK